MRLDFDCTSARLSVVLNRKPPRPELALEDDRHIDTEYVMCMCCPNFHAGCPTPADSRAPYRNLSARKAEKSQHHWRQTQLPPCRFAGAGSPDPAVNQCREQKPVQLGKHERTIKTDAGGAANRSSPSKSARDAPPVGAFQMMSTRMYFVSGHEDILWSRVYLQLGASVN